MRSHRPEAEENVDSLPLPTLTQYFTWAAQIADGMSYLEVGFFVKTSNSNFIFRMKHFVTEIWLLGIAWLKTFNS